MKQASCQWHATRMRQRHWMRMRQPARLVRCNAQGAAGEARADGRLQGAQSAAALQHSLGRPGQGAAAQAGSTGRESHG